MPEQPAVIVFDVDETLSDLSPMAHRSSDVGAPEHLAGLCSATLLRDGFRVDRGRRPADLRTAGPGRTAHRADRERTSTATTTLPSST